MRGDEREVVQLLVEGKTSKEVASILGLSPKTVETHGVNLMRKLRAHSVTELVLYAVRNNIVQAEKPVSKRMSYSPHRQSYGPEVY